jgi:restriction system protein
VRAYFVYQSECRGLSPISFVWRLASSMRMRRLGRFLRTGMVARLICRAAGVCSLIRKGSLGIEIACFLVCDDRSMNIYCRRNFHSHQISIYETCRKEELKMSRGRQSLAENLIVVASRLPWWAALVLAALSYFLLHLLTLGSPPTGTGIRDISANFTGQLTQAMAGIAQYILPLIFVISGIISAIRSFQTKRAPDPRAALSGNPHCPVCGMDMVLRTAKRGANAGRLFWGCSRFPRCQGTRIFD